MWRHQLILLFNQRPESSHHQPSQYHPKKHTFGNIEFNRFTSITGKIAGCSWFFTAGVTVRESRSPALIFILKRDAFRFSTFALQHYTKALSFIIVYGFCNCLSIKWTFWQSILWLCLLRMCTLFFSFSLTSGLHVDGCSEENSSYRSRQQNQSPWTVNMELQAKHRPLTQHLTKSFSSIVH